MVPGWLLLPAVREFGGCGGPQQALLLVCWWAASPVHAGGGKFYRCDGVAGGGAHYMECEDVVGCSQHLQAAVLPIHAAQSTRG